MKRFLIGMLGLIITVGFLSAGAFAEEKILKMSTTTSTQASGLLDVLLPEFQKDTGIKVKVIAKGTGAAIRDGKDGNVDVIFVHAKKREKKFVKKGFGTKRYAVMHNDFVIIGPPDDPAGTKNMTNAVAAFIRLEQGKAFFVSRGDDSGTHIKELALWKATGLELVTEATTVFKKGKEKQIRLVHPEGLGKWYLSIGQGMGSTISFANEKWAYTLADRGTYIKYKFGNKPGVDLEIMCQGDPRLNNPYGVIPINPKKHPHVRYTLADKFAQWLVSERGQTLIKNYKLLGHQLFYPDALP
jgi:tungstate transport system substrate-binding protein